MIAKIVDINEENPEKKTKPREYKVFVGTPYLTDGIEDYKCPIEMIEQMVFAGYDPKNLNGVQLLKTSKGNIVRLSTKETNPNATLREIASHDFAIAGSTEPVEERVLNLKSSGLVVARYSMFYSKPSGYSGRTPEQGGYSLDLPKVVGCAVTLMTNDNFLEALVSREETKIKQAIADLNQGHESAPILITPYLAKALEIQK